MTMLYEFGEFTASVHGLADPSVPPRVDLRRRGERIALPEQPSRLLVLLLQAAGVALSHREIVMGVWRQDPHEPGCRIDEDNVRVLVGQLRKILDDDGTTQRCIQTEPNRGYRLRQPVIARRRPGFAPAVAAGVAALGVIGWLVAHPQASGSSPTSGAPSGSRVAPALGSSPLVSAGADRGDPAPKRPRPIVDTRLVSRATPVPETRSSLAASSVEVHVDMPVSTVASVPLAAPTTGADALAVPAAPARATAERCRVLDALLARLDEQEGLMNRMCAGGDVGGLLNAHWTTLDLTGLPQSLRQEIADLGTYEGHLERFRPVGREAEAAQAVRAECREIRLQRSLWKLSWAAVRAQVQDLETLAACVPGDGA
jgi:DNA-binding winged helix-turn-helix (wHTH) protein